MGILDRSESRGGATVRLLAVHTTEGDGSAAQLRDADWWEGSSHAIDDETGTLLTPDQGCVPYARAAWTLRSGNHVSENIEQVGWAHFTRDQWLARPHQLDATARWLADRSKAREIPLVKLSPADVAAGRKGVIGHVDWTRGMHDGTHTDPGDGYPWDVVLEKARAFQGGRSLIGPMEEDDDMKLNAYRVRDTDEVFAGGPGIWKWVQSNDVLKALQTSGTVGQVTEVSSNDMKAISEFWLSAVVTAPLHSASDPRGDWGLVDRLPAIDAALQRLVNGDGAGSPALG